MQTPNFISPSTWMFQNGRDAALKLYITKDRTDITTVNN